MFKYLIDALRHVIRQLVVTWCPRVNGRIQRSFSFYPRAGTDFSGVAPLPPLYPDHRSISAGFPAEVRPARFSSGFDTVPDRDGKKYYQVDFMFSYGKITGWDSADWAYQRL